MEAIFSVADNAMKDYKAQIEVMKQFILDHTTVPAKTLSKKMTSDWYMNLSEQLSNGVVDEVVEDMSVLIG